MEKIFDSKKTTLTFKALEDEKARTQTLGNLKEDASDDNILALGEIFDNLAPNEEPLEKLTIVNTHHYDI